MLNLIKFFIPVFILVGIVIFLPVYLGPDDLANCDKPNQEKCKKADAIIVVSGGDTIARSREAVTLYKAGWANKIVFSGAAKDINSPSNAKVMKDDAISLGVNEGDIIIEERSENTVENASMTKRVIEENNWKRIILVSSIYHQRRVAYEFSKVLSSDVKIVNHPTRNDKLWNSKTWWLSFSGWFLAISEFIKTLFVMI